MGQCSTKVAAQTETFETAKMEKPATQTVLVSKLKSTTIHVGDPFGETLSSAGRRHIKFHDFNGLNSTRDVVTYSPSFSCHGYEWRLRIYPGGQQTTAEPGWVAIYLEHIPTPNRKQVKTRFTLKIRGKTITGNGDFGGEPARGWPKWIQRNDLISKSLTDGMLEIELELQVFGALPSSLEDWEPQQQVTSRLLKALETGENADVSFAVGDQTIRAHRFLICCQAPTLAALIEEDTTQEVVHIDRVSDAAHFRSMLRFIYSEEPSIASSCKDLQDCQGLTVVANLFGVFKLKILLENVILMKYLNQDCAIDMLIFADAHDCAILYEATMSVLLEDLPTFMRQDKWAELEKSKKLLNAILKNQHVGAGTVTFGALYTDLEASGKLDQDGTRQMLQERLDRDE